MELSEVIDNRFSQRNYDNSREVDSSILRRITEAGVRAPTAANRQPFRILLVSSEPMLSKIKQCYHKSWFQDAPHVLIVIGCKDRSWVRPEDSYHAYETDCAIAMDHMILRAFDLGVGSCWIAAFDPAVLTAALSLKENETVFAISPLGYAGKGYQIPEKRPRKPAEELVTIM